MRKKKEKKRESHPELRGLFYLGSALTLLLALVSFIYLHPEKNLLGRVGYGLSLTCHYFLGFGAYFPILFLAYLGILLITSRPLPTKKQRGSFSCLVLIFSLLLTQLADSLPSPLPFLEERSFSEEVTILGEQKETIHRYNLGGVPLYYLYKDLPFFNLKHLFSSVGVFFFSLFALFISLFFLTNFSLKQLFYTVWKYSFFLCCRALTKSVRGLFAIYAFFKRQFKSEKRREQPGQEETTYLARSSYHETRALKLKMESPKQGIKAKKKKLVLHAPRLKKNGYSLPPFTLLFDPKYIDPANLKKDLSKQANTLEETLHQFGIEARVGNINCGPTITSFEVEPPVGVKVQKIKALENDIALSMQAKSIRILAPIPGKAVVGVEVPSLHPQEVSFKEMLKYYQEGSKKFLIPILLGKTVAGDYVLADLAKMPHCLIAGATGSGKSVCINTIVMSILMNAAPDEIKLMMIDPKKVELTQYSELPHMIAPVISEPHGAYAALQWLVREMHLRYEILKQLGLRNISSFNARKVRPQIEEASPTPIPEKMPMIVCIIDEFADLMMVSSSDLETPIARIAQMARAVGIHLILATQRPSREVITGIIKANFPTRIAFKVSSRINSQIILDETGAESLLGNGDLLFLPPGSSNLVRAQGAYISDEEINLVIETISKQSPPNYLISSFDAMKKEEVDATTSRDSLYENALEVVMASKSASTTFLQRKLKIGYARAASLMDELEENGVVGPQEGSRPRKVLKDFL